MWRTSWAWLTALAFVALVAARADAAMMQHYDLASLAFESSEIVRAKVVSTRDLDNRTLVTHEVEEVYFGTLKPGDKVEVDRSFYRLQRFDASRLDNTGGKEPEATGEVILFLHPAHNASHGELAIVPSGLRVFLGDKLHRFEQFDNPGPYIAVPQGNDPFDVYGDPAAQKPVTLPVFVELLKKAMKRADDLRAAIREPLLHREELFAFVGPADGDPDAPVFGGFGFYRDALATHALEAVAGFGDIDNLLEARARASLGTGSFSVNDADYDERKILARARDAKLPLAMRLAAVEMMNRRDTTQKELVGLLGSTEPEIRIAAVAALSPRKDEPAKRAPVEALWSKEQDPSVLSMILESALSNGYANQLPRTDKIDPFVRAMRRGRKLSLVWASFGTEHTWSATRVQIKALASGKVAGSSSFTAKQFVSSWSSSGFGGADIALRFDPPLPAGTYDLTVTVDLSRPRAAATLGLPPGAPSDPISKGSRPSGRPPPSDSAVRTLTLAAMPVLERGAKVALFSGPPQPLAPVEGHPPVPAQQMPVSGPPPQPPPSGCHCAIGPGSSQATGRDGFFLGLPWLVCALMLGKRSNGTNRVSKVRRHWKELVGRPSVQRGVPRVSTVGGQCRKMSLSVNKIPYASLVVALIAFVCASCSSEDEHRRHRHADTDDDPPAAPRRTSEAPRPDPPSKLPGQDKTDKLPNDADGNDPSKVIYLAAMDRRLFRFNPRDPGLAAYHLIGRMNCSTGSPVQSMAVDRDGTAWVFFNDRTLHKVSTQDASCTSTGYKHPSGSTTLGMAFTSNSAGSTDESLFILSADFGLATVGMPDLGVHKLDAMREQGELTGGGDGKLFRFSAETGQLAEVDRRTKSLRHIHVFDELRDRRAGYAFARYAGKFYVFTSSDLTTSKATVYDPRADKQWVRDDRIDFVIVGAGQSTRVPPTDGGAEIQGDAPPPAPSASSSP